MTSGVFLCAQHGRLVAAIHSRAGSDSPIYLSSVRVRESRKGTPAPFARPRGWRSQSGCGDDHRFVGRCCVISDK